MNATHREPVLHILDSVPDGLIERDATRLHEVLAGPTLLRLPGRRDDWLFLSVLLHGNEIAGWEAARALLARYAETPLPRGLGLFIGNVAAAHEGLRHLEWQPDHNRIWKGGEEAHQRMAGALVAEVRRWPLFAAIDIHNNTGRNPHYACVTRTDAASLQLARLFSRTVVYFLRPDTVIARAMAEFCPSVTVECGRPGEPFGERHAIDYVDASLHMEHLPNSPVPAQDLDLFRTVATLRVPHGHTFSFDEAGNGADIVFNPRLDELNFRELPAGTSLGRLADAERLVVEASDEQGRTVTRDYLATRDGELVTRVPLMPSMLTRDPLIVRQDCLGYVMRRYSPDGPAPV